MIVDHREREFENSIIAHLVEHGGYIEGNPVGFDCRNALDIATVLKFIISSQPRKWEKLCTIHQDKVEDNFIKRLCSELDSKGMLGVLRHGLDDYGVHFDLMYSAPETTLNQEAIGNYNKNILTVTRQVHFSEKNPDSALALVFFVDGLPVATAELKTEFTGQSYQNQIHQYRTSRSPQEMLFQFGKRALVHFAVDTDEVWMTTRLQDHGTHFIPFNRGHDFGSGNPLNPSGYRTAYLWEYVLQRDSWIDIIARYMHYQVERNDAGKIVNEKIIFPRYHQLDAARKLTHDAKMGGVGKNY